MTAADNRRSDIPAGQSPDLPVCVAPGCPRPPLRGLLCGRHYDHLGHTLAELATLLTADATGAAPGWRVGGGSSGGLASERAPGNLRLMAARDPRDEATSAPAVLNAWATWVRTSRQLTAPTVTRVQWRAGQLVTFTTPAPPNPTADRSLLTTHLDWIIGQPEATQFWCEIRALWSTLRGQQPVRRCTCGGPVWSEQAAGWCSWCAATWTGFDLARLATAHRPEGAA